MKTLVIIDDEVFFRKSLINFLEKQNLYNIAGEANNGQAGIRKVALSGGVFQNRLLLELVDDGLTEMGFEVLKHSLIPPNDGGIALGQAVYGMAHVQRHR